jgi:N-acylneuraminate cytidylyltransferase
VNETAEPTEESRAPINRPLVVIPARGGSKRLPRKNVRPLFDRPLMAYTIHAARTATRVGHIVVSTDDPEIAAVAREWGADVVERSGHLSDDLAPIDEALRHALDVVTGREGVSPVSVAWLQADVPLRDTEVIDRAIGLLASDEGITGVATGYRVSQHPAWMKTIDADGHIVPLHPEVTAFRMQDLPDLYLLDGAVVVMRAEILRRTAGGGVHAYLGSRPKLLLQSHPMYSLNVDTAEDFELAEMYLTRFPHLRIASHVLPGTTGR